MKQRQGKRGTISRAFFLMNALADLSVLPPAPKPPVGKHILRCPENAGTFPHTRSCQTPDTRSQPRANPVPHIFGQMTLPWMPPSSEAVEMVPSGSQLLAPPARLGYLPVPIMQPAATSRCPALAVVLSPCWHAQCTSTSSVAPVPLCAGASTGTSPYLGWPATFLWWYSQCWGPATAWAQQATGGMGGL